MATADYTWRTFGHPTSGSLNISDLLGEFDAYKRFANRGPNKINGAAHENGGVLGISSAACNQIMEAVDYFGSGFAIGFTGKAIHRDNALQNRGIGARHSNIGGLRLLFTIGDTDFLTYVDMRIPRPKRRR